MNHTYDTLIKKIDILAKALEKSTERTRTMLYLVTFFSLLIIVTSFNAYLAWDRKINAHERVIASQEFKLIPKASVKKFNEDFRKELAKSGISEYKNLSPKEMDNLIDKVVHDIQNTYKSDSIASAALDNYINSLRCKGLLLPQSDYFKLYLDRQKFTIPLIGLTCYADDLYLIGGIGLIILLTYSFFSVRRENRIVDRIAKNIDYIEISDPKDYLHDHSYNEREISLIKHNLLEYTFYGCVEFFIFNTGLTKSDYSSKNEMEVLGKTNKIGRAVLAASYWLPIFAMVFAMFFEVKSLIERYHYLHGNDIWELSIRYSIALVLLIINIRQSIVINTLNNSNSILIERMFGKIRASRENVGLD